MDRPRPHNLNCPTQTANQSLSLRRSRGCYPEMLYSWTWFSLVVGYGSMGNHRVFRSGWNSCFRSGDPGRRFCIVIFCHGVTIGRSSPHCGFNRWGEWGLAEGFLVPSHWRCRGVMGRACLWFRLRVGSCTSIILCGCVWVKCWVCPGRRSTLPWVISRLKSRQPPDPRSLIIGTGCFIMLCRDYNARWNFSIQKTIFR